VTEGEAAPAAVVEQGSRNLMMRIIVALVLAPLAIAIAYAGGWLWATLVTCTACGLYVEWLMIIDAARQTRVVASGVVALAIAGFCLASGWIDAALLVLVLGLAAVALLSPERRLWTATGFFYAAAAEIASVLVRLDQIYGFAALILILLVVWVGSLQIMLDQGKEADWFNSNVIIGLCIVTVVSLAAWIIWEVSEEHPIVDLSLFKWPNFTLGTVALCLAYGLFFGNVVLVRLILLVETVFLSLGEVRAANRSAPRCPCLSRIF